MKKAKIEETKEGSKADSDEVVSSPPALPLKYSLSESEYLEMNLENINEM